MSIFFRFFPGIGYHRIVTREALCPLVESLLIIYLKILLWREGVFLEDPWLLASSSSAASDSPITSQEPRPASAGSGPLSSPPASCWGFSGSGCQGQAGQLWASPAGQMLSLSNSNQRWLHLKTSETGAGQSMSVDRRDRGSQRSWACYSHNGRELGHIQKNEF